MWKIARVEMELIRIMGHLRFFIAGPELRSAVAPCSDFLVMLSSSIR